MIDDLLGVPAHPLLIHAPLIFVPLAAVAGAVAVALQRHRRRLAAVASVFALIALVCTQLAISSGRSLQRRVADGELVRRHADLGDDALIVVALLFIAVLVLALVPQASYTPTRAQRRRLAVAITSVVVVLAAAGSVIVVVRAGMSGAQSVWSETPPRGDGTGG